METFYGKWEVQLDKTTGVADIGKLFGWTEDKQKTFSQMKYTMLIEAAAGKNRCFIDYGGAIQKEFIFALGEPFDYSGVDGTQAKCTVIIEGGNMVESYISPEGAKWQTTREISGGNMKAITTFEGQASVKCVQELIKV